VVDPDDRVLRIPPRSDSALSIQRGQGLTQQGDLAGALLEFNKALDVNKNSSLAHYRIAEVFFLQRNYQAAANAYRECLNGDGEPRWTEVWSHIQLGKIFDVTGLRPARPGVIKLVCKAWRTRWWRARAGRYIENLAQLYVTPDFRPARLPVAIEALAVGIGRGLVVALQKEHLGDA